MTKTLRQDSVNVYQCSVTGMVRPKNEDSILARVWTNSDENILGLKALLAVADGMGGHEAGDWASKTAVEVLDASIRAAGPEETVENVLINAFKSADSKIKQAASGSSSPPGTTLSVAAIAGNQCTVAHIGDSRIYLMQNGRLTQITGDDTLAKLLVDDGKMSQEEAAASDESHLLVKAVGHTKEISPSIYKLNFKPHDILLLCSDGLTGMLPDTDIANLMLHARSPMQAGEMLCSAANKAGGHDNISVVLYSHGDWVPELIKPMFNFLKGKSVFILLAIIFILGILAVYKGSAIKTRLFPATDVQRQENELTLDDEMGDAPWIISKVIGPDSMHPMESAEFNVNVRWDGKISYRWLCDPPDAGTFSDAEKASTNFYLEGSTVARDTVSVFVRVTLGTELIEVRNLDVEILPALTPDDPEDPVSLSGSVDERTINNGGNSDDGESNGIAWWF